MKTREIENERKYLEVKQKELQLGETAQKYEKLVSEVEEKEKDLKEKDREYQSLRKELGNREEELRKWEKQLLKLQEQMKGIENREKTLRLSEDNFKRKEDEFYNVKVAQITARHAKELRHLEDVIQKQLKIATDFQRDLEGTRSELTAKHQENHELEMTVSQRDSLISQLREQINRLETNPTNANGPSNANNQAQTQIFQSSDSQSSQQQHQATNLSTLFNSQPDNDPFASNKSPVAQQQQQKSTFILPDSQLSTEQFITQLAVTRRLIYQVLERYDALPDSKTSTLLRRNHPVKVIVAAPPPPPPMEYPGYYNAANDYNSGYGMNSPAPPLPPLMTDEFAAGAQAEYKQQPPPSPANNNRPGMPNKGTSNDTNSVQQVQAPAPPPVHRVNSMTAANISSLGRASSTASMMSLHQGPAVGISKQQSLSRMNSSSITGIRPTASTRSMLSPQHQASQHQLRTVGSMVAIAEEKEKIREKEQSNTTTTFSSPPPPPAQAGAIGQQSIANASFSTRRSPAAEKRLAASASSPATGGIRGSALASPSSAKSPQLAAAPATSSKRAGGPSAALLQQSASASALSPLADFVKMSESSDGVPVATVDITMKSGFKHAVREMNVAAAAAAGSGNSPFKK